jgi:hypothetical protein
VRIGTRREDFSFLSNKEAQVPRALCQREQSVSVGDGITSVSVIKREMKEVPLNF